MARQNKYGWIPDLPDHRDHRYSASRFVLASLPKSVDLRSQCPSVYDQDQLGSCTANAIGGVHEFCQMKQGEKAFVPSRLFIYYNERSMEGTVSSDSGAMIRDGIKSINKQGVCEETRWPYDISKFTRKPSPACYSSAMGHQALKYARVDQTLAQLKGCLAEGFPFVFGFSVYESFESATVERTGKVPMPKVGEQLLGGHAVDAVGYDDALKRFIARNSYGAKWGIKGYFTIPYDYLLDTNLSDDFWTVRIVE